MMIVRFKANWKCAERGVKVREYEKGKTYSDMMDEDAKLAIDLGKAEEVREEKQKPESKDDFKKKHKHSSGK